MPEVRRLLRALRAPPERRPFHLHWSHWRRAHQFGARRGHVARRAATLPSPPPATAGGPPVPPPAPGGPHLVALQLTDARWARVAPLLPPRAPVGRPPHDARTVLAGVLWILHSHASWRALPREFGPWRTVYGRYRQWCLTGLWPRLLDVLRDTDDTADEVSL